MNIDRLSTGDNWHEPYVSGRQVIYERIIEDYEMYPQDYEEWEKEILDRDSTQLSAEEHKRLLVYMENWFCSRLQNESY